MGDLTFIELMESVARFFEAIGAVVLLVGLVLSAGLADGLRSRPGATSTAEPPPGA